MRKILLTTALVLPLGTGLALAQDTTTADPATTTATPDTAATTTGSDGAMTTTDTTTVSTSTDAAPDVTTPDADATPADMTVTATDATTTAVSDAVVQEQAQNELRVDWIIDATVTSPSGENIGDVNDLILDGDTGAMKAAIVGVGGFLGIGEKQIAIDWSRLNVNFDANQITTEMTREEAENAPGYQFREQANAPADAPAAGTTTTTDTTTTTATMPAGDMEPDANPMTGTTTDPAGGAAATDAGTAGSSDPSVGTDGAVGSPVGIPPAEGAAEPEGGADDGASMDAGATATPVEPQSGDAATGASN